MIDEELFDAEEKMEKAVSVAKEDLATLRTGRANPNMFGRIQVDYYGAPTPIPQMAAINIPEARMAVIKPYDASQLHAVEKAIRDSDLGVNPTTDGIVIRVVFPQLTEQRRRELGKTVRRKCTHALDKLAKDGEVGEDDVTRAEKELQQITDRYTTQVDELVRHKEAELLEV
jgi:ribosome recycling factor